MNPMQRRDQSSCQVLVVEDNPGDLELISTSLETNNQLHLLSASRLEHALRILKERELDIVLLDLGLPDSRGLETLERLLAAAPPIPVVVLTGDSDEDLGPRAVRAGADDFLHKSEIHTGALESSIVFASERANNKRLLRHIVNRNVDAMVVVSGDRTVRYANGAAERLFGRESLLGWQFPYEVLSRSSLLVELEPPAPPRMVQMRVADVDWGGSAGYLISIRDITDLTRAQELERRLLHADRLAAVGQLAAGVAHEINNPATVVKGNVAIARDTVGEMLEGLSTLSSTCSAQELEQTVAGLTECALELKEVLDDAHTGIGHINSIVGELGAFSRIERSEVVRCNINDAVVAACKMAEHELKHLATVEKRLGTLPDIAVDRTRLVQVFINLLINAAHAIEDADRGEHRVLVETRRAGGGVLIAIEDSGCGISEARKQHIFEPFYTTKPQGRGTGLGLSISTETVRRHGGELRVESELGVGSRFEVWLPAHTGLEKSVVGSSSNLPKRAPAANILLVDDDPLVSRALTRILGRDHTVTAVTSGEEAIQVIERAEAEIDVLLCDIMMPDMDGEDVHREIATRFPSLVSRVIFMTGGIFSERARSFIEDVGPRVLQKPVDYTALNRAIRQVLEKAPDKGTS